MRLFKTNWWRNIVTPRAKDIKKGTCGCGRSPTGDCIGWHGLTEEGYKVVLEQYNKEQNDELGRSN